MAAHRRYVAIAMIAGISVPLLPFVAWLVGGMPLGPAAFTAFLAASVGYLCLIAAATVFCALRELSRFFAGESTPQTPAVRTMLVPLLGVPSDPPIPTYRASDEAR